MPTKRGFTMKYLPIISLVLVLIVAAYSYSTLEELRGQLRQTLLSLEELEGKLNALATSSKEVDQPHYVTLYFIHTTETDFVLTPIKREFTEKPTPLLALQALVDGPLPEE